MSEPLDFANIDGEDEHEGAETPSLRLGRGMYDISIAEYIADPCVFPSLRSSDVQAILHQCPAKVRTLHPRLSDDPARAIRKATKRMDLGSVVHELVLGKGMGFTVIDKREFKTKTGQPAKGDTAEYKEAVADAKSRGLVVLSSDADKIAQSMANRIAQELESELGIWPLGKTELTLIWSERADVDGQPVDVWFRARPDVLVEENAIGLDLKTVGTGLGDEELQRTMSGDDGKMFVQSALQRRGIVALFPKLRDRLNPVTHIFAETEAPFLVRAKEASRVSLEQADRRITRARDLWARCMVTNEWPKWERGGAIGAAAWLEKTWIEDEGDIET